MLLAQAIQTGKPFKRPHMKVWFLDITAEGAFIVENLDILVFPNETMKRANDWVIKDADVVE